MEPTQRPDGVVYTGLHQIGRGHSSQVWLAESDQTPRELLIVKMAIEPKTELHFVTGAEPFESRIARGQVPALHGPSVAPSELVAFRKLLLPSNLCHFLKAESESPREALAFRDIVGPSVHEYTIFCPGSQMPWSMSKTIIDDAIEALQYLHKHGIGHGDFSTRNLFLQLSPPLSDWSRKELVLYTTKRQHYVASKSPLRLTREDIAATLYGPGQVAGHVMLGDFGSSFLVRETDRAGDCLASIEPPERMAWEAAGAAPWAENEVPPWGLPADIWALGSTMLSIITGRRLIQPMPPDQKTGEDRLRAWRERVPETDDADLVQNVMVGRLREADVSGLGETMIQHIGRLLASMMKWRPDDRIGMAQVVDDWHEMRAV